MGLYNACLTMQKIRSRYTERYLGNKIVGVSFGMQIKGLLGYISLICKTSGVVRLDFCHRRERDLLMLKYSECCFLCTQWNKNLNYFIKDLKLEQ